MMDEEGASEPKNVKPDTLGKIIYYDQNKIRELGTSMILYQSARKKAEGENFKLYVGYFLSQEPIETPLSWTELINILPHLPPIDILYNVLSILLDIQTNHVCKKAASKRIKDETFRSKVKGLCHLGLFLPEWLVKDKPYGILHNDLYKDKLLLLAGKFDVERLEVTDSIKTRILDKEFILGKMITSKEIYESQELKPIDEEYFIYLLLTEDVFHTLSEFDEKFLAILGTVEIGKEYRPSFGTQSKNINIYINTLAAFVPKDIVNVK